MFKHNEILCKSKFIFSYKCNCLTPPAAKSNAVTHSLPHQQDGEENWKGKNKKTHGLR